MPDKFHALVAQCIPDLRGYANALCRNADAAEDLVQDVVVRSLSARGQFVAGTNFKAWVSTILRNRFLDQQRRTPWEPLEKATDRYFVASPSQETAVQFDEFARAFWRLRADLQEVLVLVGANGLNYREAAETLGCPIGTVRSRLSRARAELRSIMNSRWQPWRTQSPGRRAKGAPEFLESLSRVARQDAWRRPAGSDSLAADRTP